MTETAYNVARQGVAGGGGGLVAFLLLERWTLNREMEEALTRHRVGDDLLAAFFSNAWEMALFGAVIGALISAALTFGDELGTARFRRIAGRTGLALAAGALVGGAGSFLAQILFTLLLVLLKYFFILGLMFARAVVWAVAGAGIGLACGLITGSRLKIRHGMLGGAIGGAVGGGLFDVLGAITHQGTVSRCIGLTAVGICAGVAIALVQEFTKQAWITVLTGSREGTQYILNKPQLSVGRAELADVPLFGDPALDRAQALITEAPGGYMVQEVGSTPLLCVDGQPAASTWLQDGSLLELGRHRLRFHCRGATAPQPAAQDAPFPLLGELPASSTPGWGSAPAYETAEAWEAPPAGIEGCPPPIQLRAEAGPCAGGLFAVPATGCRIGRTPDNEIALLADGRVSRQHAEIFPEGEGWVMRDLGSHNGTAVNGERVTEAWINPGDQLQIGAGVYRVEAAREA